MFDDTKDKSNQKSAEIHNKQRYPSTVYAWAAKTPSLCERLIREDTSDTGIYVGISTPDSTSGTVAYVIGSLESECPANAPIARPYGSKRRPSW